MPQANVTLPDGTKARVTFDTPEQLDAAVNDLNTQVNDRTTDKLGVPHPGEYVSRALGEPTLKVLSGMAGAAAGGVAGIARGAGAGAASLAQGEGLEKAKGAFVDEAASTIRNVGEAMTIEPKTTVGRAATKVAEAPFTLLAKGADIAGEKTSEVTGSPAAGAAVNTLIQAAPGAVLGVAGRGRTPRPTGGVRRGPFDAVPRETPAAAPDNSVPPISMPKAPELEPEELEELISEHGLTIRNQTEAERAFGEHNRIFAFNEMDETPSEVTSLEMLRNYTPDRLVAVPRALFPDEAPRRPTTAQEAPGAGQPSGAPGASPAAEPGAGAAEQGGTPQERRARAYAGNLGLDWARLGAGVRAALTTIAADAGALERLNPDAVRRQAATQSLRIPVRASQGQLSLDPVQLRREALAATTDAGKPIKQIDLDANRDIQANLEVLRGRVGGQRGGLHDPTTEEGRRLGPSIRESTPPPTRVGESVQTAARAKAKLSKDNYDRLYEIARETEPTAEAGLAPITELIKKSPAIQHLDWVNGWIKRTRATRELPEGQALEKVTLSELDDLRSEASGIAGANAGKESFYAGRLVRAIDKAMQDVPAGAKAWRAAINAFRKHKQEYSDQSAVRKLVEDRKGDRGLALEKTWKTVVQNGSLESLRQVKKTLLTEGTPATRAAGRRAWRDMRAETVNRILEDARNVSSTDAAERRLLTAVALKRSLDRIPRENLEEVLGKRNVRELKDILRAREITRGRTTESGTVPNALVLFEQALKHIPGGKYAVGAAHGLKKVGDLGAGARTAAEAAVTPLEQAAQAVQKAGPTLPTAGGAGPDTIGAALPKPPQ